MQRQREKRLRATASAATRRGTESALRYGGAAGAASRQRTTKRVSSGAAPRRRTSIPDRSRRSTAPRKGSAAAALRRSWVLAPARGEKRAGADEARDARQRDAELAAFPQPGEPAAELVEHHRRLAAEALELVMFD